MTFEVSSEFAVVVVALDHGGNGPRLRVEDRRTGKVRYFDALELETLVWSSPEDMALLLDPSRSRWRDGPEGVADLARRIYPALAAGDRDGLMELLAEDFVGHFATGLPAPIGGRHDGRRSVIEDGWWAIGRRFRVQAHPEDWLPCPDGRIVVLGRYRGRHRDENVPIDAAFAHVWTGRGGKLQALHQITDTVGWGLGPE